MSQNPFAPSQPSYNQNVLNPFDRTEQRFPDILAQDQQLYGQQYSQAQSIQPQYAHQQQQQQQHPQMYQQQQYQQPQATGFQPNSSFGQQLQYQMTGAVAPTYAQQPGTYAAEFDPYGSFGGIPNSFDQRQQRQPSPSPQSRLQPPHSSTPSLNSTAHPTSYNAHPRKVVENNKQALESWNESAWQTFLKRVSELREAWEKRKASILHALENQRGRQLQYDEQQRFQKLLKEAEDNIDVMVASNMQIDEVRSGYRHSTDNASRARVRQALNEALRSMPDWPEDLYIGPAAASPSSGPSQQQPQMMYQNTMPQQQQYMNQQYTSQPQQFYPQYAQIQQQPYYNQPQQQQYGYGYQ